MLEIVQNLLIMSSGVCGVVLMLYGLVSFLQRTTEKRDRRCREERRTEKATSRALAAPNVYSPPSTEAIQKALDTVEVK